MRVVLWKKFFLARPDYLCYTEKKELWIFQDKKIHFGGFQGHQRVELFILSQLAVFERFFLQNSSSSQVVESWSRNSVSILSWSKNVCVDFVKNSSRPRVVISWRIALCAGKRFNGSNAPSRFSEATTIFLLLSMETALSKNLNLPNLLCSCTAIQFWDA